MDQSLEVFVMEHTQSNRSENGGRESRRRSLAQRLKADSHAKMETGKRSAADQIDQIADAIDVAGAQLDQQQPTIASYASQVATGAGKLANHLRSSSIEDLVRDVRNVATRNPALFIVGGIALGAVITRLMRLSDGPTTAAEVESQAGRSRSQTAGSATTDRLDMGTDGLAGDEGTGQEEGEEEEKEEPNSVSQSGGELHNAAALSGSTHERL